MADFEAPSCLCSCALCVETFLFVDYVGDASASPLKIDDKRVIEFNVTPPCHLEYQAESC